MKKIKHYLRWNIWQNGKDKARVTFSTVANTIKNLKWLELLLLVYYISGIIFFTLTTYKILTF